MIEQTNQPYIDDDQEIDIMELISKLWKKRAMIIKWCVAGAVIGLIAGFSIPKTYTASVSFAPETQQKTSGSVSSIASMMGVNINNSVDALSVDMYPDIVHSTPFIVGLFDIPVTFERKDSVINTTLLEYMIKYQRSSWWSYIKTFPFKLLGWFRSVGLENDIDVILPVGEYNINNLPAHERGVVGYFAENIIVNVDKKTGKISMSLRLQDPEVVFIVMKAVTDSLQNYMSEYRTSKSRQDIENLEVICEERKVEYYAAQQAYAQYVDANKSVVRQSSQAELERLQQEMNLAYQVYSQVASQLEGSRIQEQQAKPVFFIIDPISIPLGPSSPNKVKFIIMFTLLFGCCAAVWVLLGEYYLMRFKAILK